jgi:hypothetical protein
LQRNNHLTPLAENLKLTKPVGAAVEFLTYIRTFPIEMWARTISCFETTIVILFSSSKIVLR